MNPELFIDIETIPDQRPGAREKIAETISPPKAMTKAETIARWEAEERPRAIEDAWRKTALDGSKGQIAVISVAFGDEDPFAFFSSYWSRDEGEVIAACFAHCAERLEAAKRAGSSLRPRLIGHNHTGFDLRFIWQRCVILGVRPPVWLPVNPKPWDDHIFDTMVAWAGLKGYARMDDVCESLGIAGKGSEFEDGEDIDGSMVWDYVRDGKIEKVAQYCNGDVLRTREMYRRMTFTGT